LHARTYRFEGHYFGEPQVYRSKEEIQEARLTIDPIKLMFARLFETGLLTQPEFEAIEQSAQQAVETARKFAEESPEPDPEEYARYVYAA
jgi:pyruvate dehydrogenase E1 component alpha subunit